jgi:hypothetical protein
MQTIYEPVVPIDSFNIDKVSIKNSVFVYDDPIYTSFATRIMLDNVPLHFSQKKNISTVKIHSPQLMQIQMELEKKIKESRISQNNQSTEQSNDKLVDREIFYPYISINFTDKSKVDLIPTKVSNKPRIHIKTKDEFYSQLISYYKNKFDGINAKANIILKPIILKQKNLVLFEIDYAEVSHSLNYNNSNMYKKLYSCDKLITMSTIEI